MIIEQQVSLLPHDMNYSKTCIMNKVRFMSEEEKKDVMTRRKAYASDDTIPLDDVIELYREVILFKRSYQKCFAGYALINHCYNNSSSCFFFFFNKKKERNIFTLINLIYMYIYNYM